MIRHSKNIKLFLWQYYARGLTWLKHRSILRSIINRQWVLNGLARLPRGLLRRRDLLNLALQHYQWLLSRRINGLLRGSIPSEGARAAMFLGQTFDMLDNAISVIENYQESVLGSEVHIASLALCLKTRNQIESKIGSSLACMKQALDAAPNYAEAWCEYGRILLDNRRYQEAQLAFSRAVRSPSFSDPDRNPESVYGIVSSVYVKALYWRGVALQEAGKENRAIYAYSHCLIVQPSFAAAARQLANISYQRGLVEVSLKYYTIAMNYSPLVVALPRVGRNLHQLAGIISEKIAVLGSSRLKTSFND